MLADYGRCMMPALSHTKGHSSFRASNVHLEAGVLPIELAGYIDILILLTSD